jgi:hypothetical protein
MSYKRYKSAAHNFARSYASGLNWFADDFVMSYLARAAVRTGRPELHIDLVSGVAGPPELLSPPVAASIQNRVEQFPRHLRAEGTDPAKVRHASLAIRFELPEHRFLPDVADYGGAILIPFSATVRILDDRGVEHIGEHRDVWATEPREPPQREPAPLGRRWWQFWR